LAKSVIRPNPLGPVSPTGLPTTVAGFDAARVRGPRLSLNDLVEQLMRKAWDAGNYRRYLDATNKADTIEGSFYADDLKAAEYIRNLASDQDVEEIANQKLTTLAHCQLIVLNRRGLSREQRRNMIGTYFVPPAATNWSEAAVQAGTEPEQNGENDKAA
jgi:hypothetical protein